MADYTTSTVSAHELGKETIAKSELLKWKRRAEAAEARLADAETRLGGKIWTQGEIDEAAVRAKIKLAEWNEQVITDLRDELKVAETRLALAESDAKILRDGLHFAVSLISSGHLVSIGSLRNTRVPQIAEKDLEHLRSLLSKLTPYE